MFVFTTTLMNAINNNKILTLANIRCPKPTPTHDMEEGRLTSDASHVYFAEGLMALSPMHSVVVHSSVLDAPGAPNKGASRFMRGDGGNAKRELFFE